MTFLTWLRVLSALQRTFCRTATFSLLLPLPCPPLLFFDTPQTLQASFGPCAPTSTLLSLLLLSFKFLEQIILLHSLHFTALSNLLTLCQDLSLFHPPTRLATCDCGLLLLLKDQRMLPDSTLLHRGRNVVLVTHLLQSPLLAPLTILFPGKCASESEGFKQVSQVLGCGQPQPLPSLLASAGSLL